LAISGSFIIITKKGTAGYSVWLDLLIPISLAKNKRENSEGVADE